MNELSLEDGIRSRRSVRGFLPDPVPQKLLDKVFELAQWAPSGTNIQPWQVYVASGATRDALRAEFIRRAQSQQQAKPDHMDNGKLGEPWRERRRDCAKALYSAMDIDWDDKEGRGQAAFRNFELFDAPHVAFLCMDDIFGKSSAADVGMYAQTLMLSLTAHGLASCAQGTMAHHPDLIRDTFNLDPSVKVLFGISFGYEDPTIAANNARTTRAALSESVVFCSD
ncbi:MAG: nitroreductase [Gammaproteobacteria bacterium]|jgi:nitroreductase|nr:nitroreductase [Gammaproteobacteria bacterium]MBT4492162.1 nitroreductase [Gammaproteobacteria bacterium]MBT7372150.1 nitroreductase [Gammaproteobacteria bacterium]